MPGSSNTNRQGWPQDVGIHAIEVYFPSQYVDQTQLETFDGVPAGKYTVGLCQSKMGFCSDREDINSLCLTVTQRLMVRNKLSYNEIGRLEVGTETLIDKSKSTKTVIMQLFEESGNTDLEGVDNTNACYGGTAALLNSINWVESSAWDGRYALVVAGDIAIYASGNARCTGGAGAVAMLVGANAPLIFDRGVRSSHMEHAYDFYKPDMSSEYPVVDGKLSIQCYIHALDKCYERYTTKAMAAGLRPTNSTLDMGDAFCFHAPYGKLVQKSFARIMLNDFLRDGNPDYKGRYAGLEAFKDIKLEDTYFDKSVESAVMQASKALFEKKTRPSLLISNQVGNMYTPSVYAGLCSYISSQTSSSVAGKRVILFSYGSGLSATMFSMHFSDNKAYSSAIDAMVKSLSDLKARLDARTSVPPAEFDSNLKLREQTHHLAPYTPVGSTQVLAPGTWYVTDIDNMHRRKYECRSGSPFGAGDATGSKQSSSQAAGRVNVATQS